MAENNRRAEMPKTIEECEKQFNNVMESVREQNPKVLMQVAIARAYKIGQQVGKLNCIGCLNKLEKECKE